MRTATRIDFISDNLVAGEDRGSGELYVQLSVSFRIFQVGPAHVAGIIYTADGWVTNSQVQARFGSLDANIENWFADTAIPNVQHADIEYVIFCDDFGGDNEVPRTFNTNAGQRFRASV